MDIISYYTYAEERDRAFEWIEKALESHDPNVPYLGQPDLEFLRGDPRFTSALRRLNLPG